MGIDVSRIAILLSIVIMSVAAATSVSADLDFTGFDGATTNFSEVDIEAVDYPVLEKAGSFKIEWNGADLNFSGANLSQYITYDATSISVASESLPPGVNTSANITLYGTYSAPTLFRDGTECDDCARVFFNESDVVFMVPHFTEYSVGEGAANGSLSLTSPPNETIVVEDDLVDFEAELTQISGVNTSWSCQLYIEGGPVGSAQDVSANATLQDNDVAVSAYVGTTVPWMYQCYNAYYDETIQSEEWMLEVNPVPQTSLSTGLVAYYSFNNMTQSNIPDEVGYNDVPRTTETRVPAGKIWYGIGNFTGSGGIVTGDDYGIPAAGQFSFNAWVKHNPSQSGHQMVISSDTGSVFFRRTGTGGFASHNWVACVGGSCINQGVTSYDNQWVMVTFTYDGSTLKLYRMGELIASQAGVQNITYTELLIGGAFGQNTNGVLDEVGIWTRALTAADVLALNNSGDGLTYNGTDFVSPPIPTVYDATVDVRVRFNNTDEFAQEFCVDFESTFLECATDGVATASIMLYNTSSGNVTFDIDVYNITGAVANVSGSLELTVVAEQPANATVVAEQILVVNNVSTEAMYWNATSEFIVPTWEDNGRPYTPRTMTLDGESRDVILFEDAEGRMTYSGYGPSYFIGAWFAWNTWPVDSAWYGTGNPQYNVSSHSGDASFSIVGGEYPLMSTPVNPQVIDSYNTTASWWFYDDGVVNSTYADWVVMSFGPVRYSQFPTERNTYGSALVGYFKNASTYFTLNDVNNSGDALYYLRGGDYATGYAATTQFGTRSEGWHNVVVHRSAQNGSGVYSSDVYFDGVLVSSELKVPTEVNHFASFYAQVWGGNEASQRLLFDDILVYKGAPIRVNDMQPGDYVVNVSIANTSDVSDSFAVTKLVGPTTISPSGVALWSPNVSVSWSGADGNYSPITYDVYVNGTLLVADTSDTSLSYLSGDAVESAIFVTAKDALVNTTIAGLNFNVTLEYLTVQLNDTLNDSFVQSFCVLINSSGVGCTTNGTLVWLDEAAVADARSYVVEVTNTAGLYNVSTTIDVEGDASVVLQTREALVNPAVSTSAAAYWTYSGGDVVVNFNSSNVGVTRTVKLVGTNGTTLTLTNVTGSAAYIPTSSVPAPLAYVANVTESATYGNTTAEVSAISAQFVVSALQAGNNISPTNTTVFKTATNVTWSPATGGYGAITYNVSATVNGVNAYVTTTSNTYAIVSVGVDANVTPVIDVSDGYVTVTDVGQGYVVNILQAVFNLSDYVQNTSVSSFCISVNGTGIGCTTNGSVVWDDSLAEGSTRSYNVSAYNASGKYDVSYVLELTGDTSSTLATRSVLSVTNVTTNKSAYWNGTDTSVVVSWLDTIYNGTRTLYADGVTPYNGTVVPVADLAVGQHTVTVEAQEVVAGVTRYANATSASFVVSKLTHNDNVSPSGVQFYNPQIVISWLPASGNASSVTYDVVKNLNGTNVTIASGISDTSLSYNVSQETTNGIIYVKAYDNGYASQTMSNAIPFNVSLQYLTVRVNDTYTNQLVQNFCVDAPFSGCTTNGSITWLDMDAISLTRSYNVSQTNGDGKYNTSRAVSVTGDEVITLRTRPVLTLSNVVTDKQLYWNKTDTNVVTTWTSNNGSATVQTVAYDDGQTGASVAVNSFTVGVHNATVYVSEIVESINQSVSVTSGDFNVTKLAAGNILSPIGVLSTRYNQNVSWSAATNGLGAVTYTVVLYNGTNTTLQSGVSYTDFLYNVSAQNVANGVLYVRASDSYVTDVAQSNFTVQLDPHVLSVACPATTLPNEDNMPSRAILLVNASTYAETAIGASPSVNASRGAVLPTTTNCTMIASVGDNQEWQCYVPMNYWYEPGNYTTVFNWGVGSNFTQCEYAELLASQRTTTSVYFPNAAPGVVNASASDPVVIRNTGNAEFNVSMKAYDLAGRSVPAQKLVATSFFGGASLGSSVQMQNDTERDVNIVVSPSSGAQGNIRLWLSMPAGQLIQEYYTSTPWQVVVNG